MAFKLIRISWLTMPAFVLSFTVTGIAMPAEMVNGITFDPPSGWVRTDYPDGGIVYEAPRITSAPGCPVVVVPIPQELSDAVGDDFHTWFEYQRQREWENFKARLGGSDEELGDIYYNRAQDGSEVLSSDNVLNTTAGQFIYEIVAAKKNGRIALFFTFSKSGLLYCMMEASDVIASVGGGWDRLPSGGPAETAIGDEGDQAIIDSRRRSQCMSHCAQMFTICNSGSTSCDYGDSYCQNNLSCDAQKSSCEASCAP